MIVGLPFPMKYMSWEEREQMRRRLDKINAMEALVLLPFIEGDKDTWVTGAINTV